mgnify:CR=1 FL=1
MENIPENIKTIINSCYPYIEDFNPAQKAVIESGSLENNKNCVIAIPTASGKTVLGIMAALKSILDGGKAVYAAPLLSIQNEKVDFVIALNQTSFDKFISKVKENGTIIVKKDVTS